MKNKAPIVSGVRETFKIWSRPMMSKEKRKWQRTSGYAVVFPDFEHLSFFVHRITMDGREWWRVSETTTGSAVTDGAPCKNSAVDDTYRTLRKQGRGAVDAAITSCRAKIEGEAT